MIIIVYLCGSPAHIVFQVIFLEKGEIKKRERMSTYIEKLNNIKSTFLSFLCVNID